MPHLADQFFWADRLQRLGAAPPAVRRGGLRSDELAAALAATLDNELLAERARELGDRLRERCPVAENPTLLLD